MQLTKLKNPAKVSIVFVSLQRGVEERGVVRVLLRRCLGSSAQEAIGGNHFTLGSRLVENSLGVVIILVSCEVTVALQARVSAIDLYCIVVLIQSVDAQVAYIIVQLSKCCNEPGGLCSKIAGEERCNFVTLHTFSRSCTGFGEVLSKFLTGLSTTWWTSRHAVVSRGLSL